MQQKGFAKLSLIFTIIASVCMIIGVVTPNWYTNGSDHGGIWGKKAESWIQPVRVCGLLGFICTLMTILLLILYIRRDDGHTNLRRIRLAIVSSMVSFIFCMAAIIVYAQRKLDSVVDFQLAWSYILTAFSGALVAIVILPLAVEIRKSRALGSYESI